MIINLNRIRILIGEAYRYICLLVCFLFSLVGMLAQDKIPSKPVVDKVFMVEKSLPPYISRDMLKVKQKSIIKPYGFKTIKASVLDENKDSLGDFFGKLEDAKRGVLNDSLTVVHIGDSHIRGHIFPQTLALLLKADFGMINLIDMGVNGATTHRFTNVETITRIKEYTPDLIIISFGTNESHNKAYSSDRHNDALQELIGMLRQSMPEVPLLMTTPPGSYERYRIRRRRYGKRVNPRTESAVETIRKFSKTEKIALWDLYDIVGGKRYACENWTKSKMMRRDGVHFYYNGYVFQGELLHSAIIKAYNEYVANH